MGDRLIGLVVAFPAFALILFVGENLLDAPSLVVGPIAWWLSADVYEAVRDRLAYADEVLGLTGGDVSR